MGNTVFNNGMSLKKRGVVRSGPVIGQKNGSLPNFMPPEGTESRTGGVMIASDEDDLADLYLLEQVVGPKTKLITTD